MSSIILTYSTYDGKRHVHFFFTERFSFCIKLLTFLSKSTGRLQKSSQVWRDRTSFLLKTSFSIKKQEIKHQWIETYSLNAPHIPQIHLDTLVLHCPTKIISLAPYWIYLLTPHFTFSFVQNCERSRFAISSTSNKTRPQVMRSAHLYLDIMSYNIRWTWRNIP